MKEPLLVQPGLDIVVVNFRTPDDLDACLESISENPPIYPHDVWIVNVTPTPEDRDVTAKWQATTHWREFVFGENVGYNRAVNIVGDFGDREVIVACNADIAFTNGALDDVFDEMIKRPDWAIAGPRQVDDRGRITAAGIFLDRNGRPRHRGWHERANSGCHQDIRDDCATVAGAAYFIRREIWDELTECPIYQEHFPGELGPMSDCQHFYGDELCAWAARAHGYKLGYVGTTTILHKHQGAGRPNPLWTKDDKAKFEAFRDAHPENAHG